MLLYHDMTMAPGAFRLQSYYILIGRWIHATTFALPHYVDGPGTSRTILLRLNLLFDPQPSLYCNSQDIIRSAGNVAVGLNDS